MERRRTRLPPLRERTYTSHPPAADTDLVLSAVFLCHCAAATSSRLRGRLQSTDERPLDDAYSSGESPGPSASSRVIIAVDPPPGAARASDLTSRFCPVAVPLPPAELLLLSQPARDKQTRQAVRAATRVRIIVPIPLSRRED